MISIKKYVVATITFLLMQILSIADTPIRIPVSVEFTIKNAGIKVSGSFKEANAMIRLYPEKPNESTFDGLAIVNTIHTGIGMRDEHIITKEEFFNAKKFPQITMKSLRIKPKSAGIYTVLWELTIKGITKQIESDVYALAGENGYRLTTQFTINRLDWTIGSKSITMSNSVEVRLSALIKSVL